MKSKWRRSSVDPLDLSLNTDAGSIARAGLWVLLFGFGGFMLWAGLAPLDQGMTGTGTVVVSGEKKTVQPRVSGVVDAIPVRDGQEVVEGQTLVLLNRVQAQAQLETTLGQWINVSALEARLRAEQAGLEKIAFPQALLTREQDPRAVESMNSQIRLFDARRKDLQLKMNIIDNELQSLEGQLAGFQEIKRHQESRLNAQRKELDSFLELVKKGFVSWNRIHEVERDMGELSVDLATAITNIGRTQQAIQENRLNRMQVMQLFKSEVETQLTSANADLSMLAERIKALEFEVDSATIRAPADGQIMDVAIHTVGGVVQAGQRLMDIVPLRSSWIIKSRFPTMVADRLKPGLPVAIRFSSLQRISTPVLTGSVDSVSPDQIIDGHTQLPYYQAYVLPDNNVLSELKRVGLEVKPGMEVEVMVNTGERTLFNYLVKPISERLTGALREE